MTVTSNNAIEASPAAHPQGRPGPRRLAGVAVGVVVLALVAIPVAFAAFVAALDFAGCTDGCSGGVGMMRDTPAKPGQGIIMVGIALLLLALPVVAGVLVARVRSRRGRLISGLAGAVLLTLYLLLPGLFGIQGLLGLLGFVGH